MREQNGVGTWIAALAIGGLAVFAGMTYLGASAMAAAYRQGAQPTGDLPMGRRVGNARRY